MKTFVHMLAVLTALMMTMVACNKDQDDDDNDNTSNYNFINQDLQGKIEGNNWIYNEGTYEESYWDSTEFEVDLYDTTGLNNSGSMCSYYGSDLHYKIMFSCPKEVGLYELKFSAGVDGQTVTIVDYSADPINNIICVLGALEIISVSDSVVTGRLDARDDAQTYVNGNFTLHICN